MPKRSSKKQSGEAGQAPATDPVAEKPAEAKPEASQGTTEGKNPAAVALGRLGGKKGGVARAQKLTKEQRREIARKAAQARWAKKSK